MGWFCQFFSPTDSHTVLPVVRSKATMPESGWPPTITNRRLCSRRGELPTPKKAAGTFQSMPVSRCHTNLPVARSRSEEHTSELQSPDHLVCRLLLEKKKKQ